MHLVIFTHHKIPRYWLVVALGTVAMSNNVQAPVRLKWNGLQSYLQDLSFWPGEITHIFSKMLVEDLEEERYNVWIHFDGAKKDKMLIRRHAVEIRYSKSWSGFAIWVLRSIFVFFLSIRALMSRYLPWCVLFRVNPCLIPGSTVEHQAITWWTSSVHTASFCYLVSVSQLLNSP